jgi:hypothetical protein
MAISCVWFSSGADRLTAGRRRERLGGRLVLIGAWQYEGMALYHLVPLALILLDNSR